MNTMNELFSIKEINHFVNLAFLYLSKTNFGVCHALWTKVKKVMAKFPKIQMVFVNVDHVRT